MVHRLALLMGGAGAAGVLALALTLNGSAPPTTPDAFVPVANDVMGADQLAQVAPTDPPALATDPGADQAAQPIKKVDTVYVLPAPEPVVVHSGKPSGGNDNQPSDTPRPARNDGDGNAGDDGQGDEADDSSDDQAGGDDEHDGGDHSDDGGSDDGGHEPGDD
ncbi:MAG: hypothetical protein ABI452_01060 [Candidatus Limnocylindrales bacterium]